MTSGLHPGAPPASQVCRSLAGGRICETLLSQQVQIGLKCETWSEKGGAVDQLSLLTNHTLFISLSYLYSVICFSVYLFYLIMSLYSPNPHEMFAFSSTASAMRLHILTEDSHILTRSGQTLTLPCVAKGKNFDPFSNPVIWYKVAHNGEEFQVCSNKSCLYYLSLLNIDGLCQLHQAGLRAGILSRSLSCRLTHLKRQQSHNQNITCDQ